MESGMISNLLCLKSVQFFLFVTLINEQLPNYIIVDNRRVVLLPPSGHVTKQLFIPPV